MALITPIGVGIAMGISIGWEVSYVLEEHAVAVGCFYGFAIGAATQVEVDKLCAQIDAPKESKH